MPSVKQGGGYTLTFSKKNQDVKGHLDTLKKEGKVKITDYLCEAVRFFEDNKNNVTENQNPIEHVNIDKIIEEKIKALMGNNIPNMIEEQKEEELELSEKTSTLEDDLSGVDDDSLEDD